MMYLPLTRSDQCDLPMQIRSVVFRKYFLRRTYNAAIDQKYPVERIRNIGIIAHIDAGKTTTSERMLYYAGYTRRIGEVDRGDTVLDYLPEERERGITITAAAITFPWSNHRVNLVDTPGHVDFGMEVERALRVMDGAVTILDGRKGVQAQTCTVWRQSERLKLPNIVYVNKMDVVGADFDRALRSLEEKLGTTALPLQYPTIVDGKVVSITDLVGGKRLIWLGDKGETVQAIEWNKDGEWLNVQRMEIMEKLAGLEDGFLEKYLDNPDQITVNEIDSTIRTLTLQNKIVPVLCGSSFKNIGIQPLLDAIVKYLPSPADQSLPNLRFKGTIKKFQKEKLLSLAFKVVFDEKRGLMVFVRVYSGALDARSTLWNSNKSLKERPTKLMMIYADKFEEVEKVTAGNMVVLLGLQHTSTGDTLLYEHEFKSGYNVEMEGIRIPQPVFTCSIEAESLCEESKLDDAIKIVELEDPSITSKRDQETGQRHISGMGELHLEIVGKRIRQDLGVKAEMGKVQIVYKEVLKITNVVLEDMLDKVLNGKRMIAAITLEISNLNELNDNRLSMETTTFPSDEIRNAIYEGIRSALQSGPKASFAVIGLDIRVRKIQISEGSSSPEAFAFLAYRMISEWIATQESDLLEPTMNVEVTLPKEQAGTIINDLIAGRRGNVLSTEETSSSIETTIRAEVPLASMLGYATHLRGRTAGAGFFSMQPASMRPLSREDEDRLVKLGQ